MIRSGELCDQICRLIGVTRKKKRSRLSKRELERILAYINVMEGQAVNLIEKLRRYEGDLTLTATNWKDRVE